MVAEDEDNASAEKPNVMSALRRRTGDAHAKLETIPYFEAVKNHKLPLACYVRQLRALSVLHGVLERELDGSTDERVLSVWDASLQKLPLLEKDLGFFERRVILDSTPSLEAALAMAEKIRLCGVETPSALLGYLYVFEGSTLGNNMHTPDIAATFQLERPTGCAYYESYGDQVRKHWHRFSDRMNRAFKVPSTHAEVLAAAEGAFMGLESVYAALFPEEENHEVYHVARINPEAGNHPIPSNDREIEASLRASNHAWAEFPYYEERYGKRGKRFSDSDTCWLATLADLEQDEIQRQVEWIGRVLATRGMSTIMLETTLRFLHEELSAAMPQRKEAYVKLLRSAELLQETRRGYLPDAVFESVAGTFDAAVGPQLAQQFRNTGKLLVSAVVDEMSGIEGTVSAIEEWMVDEGRFPTHWIDAVKSTVERVRPSAE